MSLGRLESDLFDRQLVEQLLQLSPQFDEGFLLELEHGQLVHRSQLGYNVLCSGQNDSLGLTHRLLLLYLHLGLWWRC